MVIEGKGISTKFKGSKWLQISEQEKKLCSFYEIQGEEDETTPVSHHILLVDVSGSMYLEIPELKIKVKQTLEALKAGGNHYVSIIIYSGHEESYRIVNAVKCDTLSYKMARVFETVEKELYTRSITVMSEPLETAIEIVKSLGDVCNQHHIVLMTDGCLVPYRWQVKEETQKCLKVAMYCEKMGIYLNTIGFGSYYDRKFLTKLVACAKTGQFLHIDCIKDYYKTIMQLTKEVGSQKKVSVALHHEDYFVCDQKMRYKEPITLKSIPAKGESIVVTFENEGTPTENVPEEMVTTFLYNLGIYHLIDEDLESAEIALAQTEDIEAYMAIKNCYSFVEKGKAIQTLTGLVNAPQKRYKKGKAKIKLQLPEEEPLCMLEVLREILEDPESKLLWDYQYPYKRIGVKAVAVDEDYRFIRPQIGYGEVVSLTIGSEKLNIGVKVKIEGMVEEASTGIKVAAFIYRDYNLVVNGNINTSRLWCVLSKGLKAKLRKQKIIKSTTKVNGMTICTLDLTKLKATNIRIQRALSQRELVHALYDVEVLSCKQWALKKLLENQRLEGEKVEGIDTIQKRFQIDEKGIFNPKHVGQVKDLPYEIYPATVLTWKIEKFPKKKTQEEALKAYEGMDYTALKAHLQEVTLEKRIKSNRIQFVRLACGLMGKSIFLWEKQLEKEKVKTDPILNMNTIIGEKVQIATKVVDDLAIRQDYYVMLTRCN